MGTLKVLPQVYSPQLDLARDVLIYLPRAYGRGRRFPVIYMHDGQNLFDQATSFAGEWGVDEALEQLAPQGRAAIVVGIPNGGEARIDEYSPYRDRRLGRGGRGKAYLDFVTATLKPLVDQNFHTLPEPRHTGLAGSSMGGLISLYGFFRHPEVFGFCAALSPALWFARAALFAYIRRAPVNPGLLALDVGTQEGPATLADVRQLGELLINKGYRLGQNLLYEEEPGAGHNEAAWAARFARLLPILLSTRGDQNAAPLA